MPLKVAAFYQFAALPDFRELREPLRAICAGLGLKGSVLLAHEGINGTVAGSDPGIDALIDELQHGALFGGRLDHLELKFSGAADDAVPATEDPAEKGDRHARRWRRRSDAAGRHLCRAVGLERADRCARYAGDRHPQRLRGGDGHLRGRGRSRHQELWRSSRSSPRESSTRRSTQGSRCSAPAASAAKRPAPICWRTDLPRSITSRAAS